MARIQFDGQGQPIPIIALPPFGSDKDLPSTVLTFTESVEFPVKQYRDLGFTHFEVTCVGAAGGKGGDATSSIFFATEYFRRPVPQDVWNLYLEAVRLESYFQNHTWDRTWATAGNLTDVQINEQQNPRHLMEFGVVKQVVLRPSYEAFGGGGGGGGLHKVSGALASLDDSVPITVGKAGTDSPMGQTLAPGVLTPIMSTLNSGPDGPFGVGQGGDRSYGGYWEGGTPIIPHYPRYLYFTPDGVPIPVELTTRWVQILDYLDAYCFTYPDPHNSFANPQYGGDGGTSSFADGVVQASGGKGGAPGKVYTGIITVNSQSGFQAKGDGGDGGIGGRAEPGGGGHGSVDNKLNGSDGIWHPELGIGGGGGGGKGGRSDKYGGTYLDPGLKLATAGGQGSYSYADASVYGPRQFRSSYQTVQLLGKSRSKAESEYFGDYFDAQSNGLPNGEIEYRSVPYSNTPVSGQGGAPLILLIIPGGGGGARPLKNLKYGSRAPGFSPDGVVVVRLIKI